jgi:hypothetical protein
MNGIKSMNILGMIRSSRFSRFLWIVLIFNFINLSVNFTEQYKDLDDPVDTISEMIFEWGLDVSPDTIPDNSAEEENQSVKKLVFFGTFDLHLSFLPYTLFFTPSEPYKEKFLRTIFIPLGTPPPDQG